MSDNRRLISMMVRSGVAAGIVAVLLVVWISATSIGSPEDSVETAALAPTTVPKAADDPPTSDTDAGRSFGAPTETEPDGGGSGLVIESADPVSSLESSGPAGASPSTDTNTAGAVGSPGATNGASPSGAAPVRIAPASCGAVGAPVSQTAPFTGEPASIPAGFPAVVVKVSNNSSASRSALIGLDDADIVIEERIEANATRFAAVFHSSLPENVGPVRSGRTTDIDAIANLGTPVLGYSGSNPGVARQFAHAADLGLFVPVINTDRAPFARDSRYRAPDNLFVDPTALGGCGSGGTPTPIFRYGPATSTSAQTAGSVSFDARSPFRFDWDGSAWVRSQDGWAHTTRTGAPLAVDNVLVAFVDYVPSTIDTSSVDAKSIGSGDVWLLRNGTITTGSWIRPAPSSPWTLEGSDGTRLTVETGTTWIVLAPAGSASWN